VSDAASSDEELTEPPRGVRRWIYFVLGWLFFGLGGLGAVLPVLPTTPFMILSVWAFSKSSRRLHQWLYNHPRFGRRVREFHEHRVIPLPVKLTAFGAMAVSLAYVGLVARLDWRWVLAMASVMAIGVAFISSCPNRPPYQKP